MMEFISVLLGFALGIVVPMMVLIMSLLKVSGKCSRDEERAELEMMSKKGNEYGT